MPFSDQFNNAPPATIIPSLGGAFADGAADLRAPGLAAQPDNTAPTISSRYNSQIWPASNGTPDIAETYWTSRHTVRFNAATSLLPNGSTLSTAEGFSIAAGASNGLVSITRGTFTAIASGSAASLQSVLFDGQHTFPLLLCTCSGFSFYATTVGGFKLDSVHTISGALLVTGPNGYSSRGYFYYYFRQAGTNLHPDPLEHQVLFLVNETGRFLAQPTNTAPEPRL